MFLRCLVAMSHLYEVRGALPEAGKVFDTPERKCVRCVLLGMLRRLSARRPRFSRQTARLATVGDVPTPTEAQRCDAGPLSLQIFYFLPPQRGKLRRCCTLPPSCSTLATVSPQTLIRNAEGWLLRLLGAVSYAGVLWRVPPSFVSRRHPCGASQNTRLSFCSSLFR